jgi:Fic family protein
MDWQNFRIQKRLHLNNVIIEEVYSIISEIDGVKNSWQLTEKLSPQTIKRLTHFVIVTSTGASNRIEGNRLSDKEVEILYRNLNIKKFKTRDEQEVGGYLERLKFIFEHYKEIPINESFILGMHNDMLRYSEKDLGHKGKYKIGSNRVEAHDQSGNIVGVIFDPTPPYLVRKEMQELIDWYNWAMLEKIKHPLILISNFIFEYLAIHPFQDGNGRTSRLLTNLMLLQSGYLFTTIISHEKVIESQKLDYYLALNKTQMTWKKEEENIDAWLLFFLNAIKIQSQKALETIQEDKIEYLLSEKQLALWEWAATNIASEFSRKSAIEALGYSPRTVEYIIRKLLDLGCIERIGEGKATRYRVNKSRVKT